MDKEKLVDDQMDAYSCKECDGVLLRRITVLNITAKGEILYCPFCGIRYDFQEPYKRGRI